MKKFLALFLELLMVMSLAACGGSEDTPATPDTPDTPSTGDTPSDTPEAPSDTPETPEEPEGPTVAAPEEITAEPLYYNGFETTDGLTAVRRGDKTATPEMTGATYSILPSVHEIMLLPGVDGNALAVDGKYGVKLENVPKTADDSYTIAFWYAADRYGEFMPILDIGHNTGLADEEGPAWVRFTRANTWSVTGAECAPVVWDRNAAVDTWPWIGNNADERGKKEWIHVALVTDGVEYQDSQGKPHVGATVYVNGIPVMAADASRINYSDGTQNYRNFCTVFCGAALEAGDVDPNTVEGYAEYAVVRPDNWAWTPTVNPQADATYEASWGDDWAGWLSLMTDAEVTLKITRDGAAMTMEYTFTGADGTAMTETAVVPTDAPADASVYAFIGGEGAYIELLSVE